MIIYDITEKGKNWLLSVINKLFVPLLIILVGILSYGCGMLIKIERSREPVTIEYVTSTTSLSHSPQHLPLQNSGNTVQLPVKTPVLEQGMYVAARGGTSYYFPWCATAKRISDKNKVWFASKAEAEKAGYKPATTCKGMK